jgi:hypothetical protein
MPSDEREVERTTYREGIKISDEVGEQSHNRFIFRQV